jgi:hypothetical protein
MNDIIGKKLENLVVRGHRKTSFSTAREAMQLLCPPEKPFAEYYHSSCGYLGIRVMRAKRNGDVRKTWIVRYRDADRKDQKTSILAASEKTFEEARYQAMKIRRDADHRRDSGLPAVPTLLQAYADYKAGGAKRWSKSTIKMYDKAGKYFLRFGFTKANKVTPKHMDDLIRDIKASVQARYHSFKKPTVKIDGEASALEAMRIVRAIYKDLMADGVVRYSPVAKLARQGYFDRQSPKSDAIHRDELPKFWDWLHQSTHVSTRDYILVGLFMAFRRSLIGNLTWENVDAATRTYIIDASAEGNKAKKEIPFPIPAYLWDTVFEPRMRSENKHPVWVIPSPKKVGQPLKSIRGALKAMQALTHIKLSVHGLRRTSGTLMHAATGSELLAVRLLTHRLDAAGSRGTNTAGYVITTDKDLREAMDKMVAFALDLAIPRPRAQASINDA